jgi:tRNA pseudouridine55 synthase
VRTYAHEIGQELGCGAHLSALRRTRSGKFLADAGVAFAELKENSREQVRERVLSLASVSKLRGA